MLLRRLYNNSKATGLIHNDIFHLLFARKVICFLIKEKKKKKKKDKEDAIEAAQAPAPEQMEVEERKTKKQKKKV